MKKSEIVKGMLFVQKAPYPHTEQLQRVSVLSIKQHYEHGKKSHNWREKRMYSYVYYKVCEGQYYPASNGTPRNPLILDGLVGCCLLTEFKTTFKPLQNE